MSEIEITDLMKGISKAIKEAQAYIEDNSLEIFYSYFETQNSIERKEGPLRSKTKKFLIPNVEGMYIEKNIPVVSLVNHHSLQLEEVRLKMQVTGRWDNGTNKLMVNVEPIPHDLDSTKREDKKYAEIELIFKKNDAPEGVQRILLEHYKVQ